MIAYICLPKSLTPATPSGSSPSFQCKLCVYVYFKFKSKASPKLYKNGMIAHVCRPLEPYPCNPQRHNPLLSGRADCECHVCFELKSKTSPKPHGNYDCTAHPSPEEPYPHHPLRHNPLIPVLVVGVYVYIKYHRHAKVTSSGPPGKSLTAHIRHPKIRTRDSPSDATLSFSLLCRSRAFTCIAGFT